MNEKLSRKKIKVELASILTESTRESCRMKLDSYPAKKIIGPLFSLLHSAGETLRWRSITAMGMVTAKMFDQSPEDARIIMRRLIWNLNDESGGIGWGSPEAMGDIMARNSRAAGEYNRILVSYVRPDGNYLELEPLQRGVLWGIARVAGSHPEFLKDLHGLFLPYMASQDPALRILAALCAVKSGMRKRSWFPQSITGDTGEYSVFSGWDFKTVTTGSILESRFHFDDYDS